MTGWTARLRYTAASAVMPESILLVGDGGNALHLSRNHARVHVSGGHTLRVFYHVDSGETSVLNLQYGVTVGFHHTHSDDKLRPQRNEEAELRALAWLRGLRKCACLRHLVARVLREPHTPASLQQEYIVLYETYDGDAFILCKNLITNGSTLQTLRWYMQQAVRSICVQLRAMFQHYLLYTDIKFENLLFRQSATSCDFMLCDYSGIRGLKAAYTAKRLLKHLPHTSRWLHLSLRESCLTRETYAALVQHSLAYEYRRFLSTWFVCNRLDVCLPYIESCIATDVTQVVVMFFGLPCLDLMCTRCVQAGRPVCSCARGCPAQSALPSRSFSSPSRLQR